VERAQADRLPQPRIRRPSAGRELRRIPRRRRRGNERLYNYLDFNGVAFKEKQIKLAFACLLTAVGIPMILAGDEFADEHDIDIFHGSRTAGRPTTTSSSIRSTTTGSTAIRGGRTSSTTSPAW
jgi:hypothetical protein